MNIKLTKKQKDEIGNAIYSFNNWQGHAVIEFDTDDNECWCDVFASNEEWKEYHSDSIYVIISKDNLYGRDTRLKKEGIIDIIENGYFKEYLYECMSDEAAEAYENVCIKESSQEKWQKKVGLISKSYKLNKSLVDKFADACEKSNTTQSKQLSKMMQDFVDSNL